MLSFRTGKRLFAHRGLHGDRSVAPENSMEAFRRAADAGYGIEMDIQFSRDRQIVVFHDDTLQRVCHACGRVCDFTYEELQQFTLHDSQERIPLFSEVLKMVNGRVPLVVELKAAGGRYDRELCEKTAELLDRYPGEFCVESFHPRFLYWFRWHRPLYRRGQLCTDFFLTNARGWRWQFFLFESMALNLLTRPDFVAFDIRYRHHPAFRFWKRFCTPVGWTLRPESEHMDLLNKDFKYFIAEKAMSSD